MHACACRLCARNRLLWLLEHTDAFVALVIVGPKPGHASDGRAPDSFG